jgi:hypothetical protein
MSLRDEMIQFIGNERDRLTVEHSNVFAMQFSKVTRYYDFLEIILSRYDGAGKRFVENSKALQATFKEGQHPTTGDQLELHARGKQLTTDLHLEIESFYVFGKMLLDRVANTIEYYFGQVRKRPLDSHDDLVKNLEEYSRSLELEVPATLMAAATSLKEKIADHRDYEVAHEKNPRSVFATVFYADGRTSIANTKLYPKASDKQAESKDLNELFREIDQYLQVIMNFIRSNGRHSRLNTSDQSST